MPYIIPNATDVDGTKFIALDQAEPDSLDFQILGDRSTGVLSGCAVTASTTSGALAIASGYVALSGVVYPVSGDSSKALSTGPSSGYRFDVVVVRCNPTTNTSEITIIDGVQSVTNPTYPKSAARLLTTTGVSTSTYITENDVVLAVVFRQGTTAPSNANIVDKRVNVPSTTSLRGSAIPSNGIGSDGDFYYKTTVGPSSAGVYVKRDGVWVELLLSGDSGSVTPIGAIIMWPSNSTSPNPAGKTFWLECDGSMVSKATYSELSGLLGTTYGADTSTQFKLPNMYESTSKFVSGSSTAGTVGGSQTINLSTNNIPAHNHSLNGHTHTVGDHTHNIAHGHGSGETVTNGQHSHQPLGGQDETPSEGIGFATRLGQAIEGVLFPGTLGWLKGYVVPGSATSDLIADGLTGIVGQGMQVHYTFNTTEHTGHRHVFVTPDYTGTSGGLVNGSATTGTSTGNTGNTGEGSPVTYTPPNISMRWFIRAK
jgi:microcystin-dependent protein